MKLFDDTEFIVKQDKSYRAIRHNITRNLQSNNSNILHHPKQKINQLNKCITTISNWCDLSILELFAGEGNLTVEYSKYGEVLSFEKNKNKYEKLKENTKECYLLECINSDSFLEFHKFIYLKQKFDVIDLDPYGYPNRFFPDIFLLIDNGIIFITMPKPYVNILNGITATHLISYYGEQNPSLEIIINKIVMFGLCHWRKLELLDVIDCKSIWRMAFKVEKVKSTEYTNTKNR